MLRVLLCDDAGAFTVLLTHWMQDCEGVEVIGHSRTPEEAEQHAAEHQPDVIVLDHMLSSQTSAQLVPRLRVAAAGAAILLISGMSQDDLAKAAATSRPDGFISKASRPDELCDAVHAVARRSGPH